MPSSKSKQRFNQKTIIAVQQFINSRSWKEAKKLVEGNRQLMLTNEADAILEEMEKKYSSSLWDTEVPIIREHRELLARYRKESIEVTFAERVPKPKPKSKSKYFSQV